MKFSLIWKLATREIRNNLRFCLFFVFNLSIGLTGFITLDSFRDSLNESLKTRAKEFLGADLSVSVRRYFTPEELSAIEKAIPASATKVQQWEMMAMATSASATRLVQLKGIEPNFPFYGSLQLQERGDLSGGMTGALFEKPRVWMYPELQNQLEVKLGDIVKLGGRDFVVDDLVVQDSGQTFRGASLAPRIYVALPYLQKTSLIGFGTTMTQAFLYHLPEGVDLELIRKNLKKSLIDQAIHIETPAMASEDTGRSLNYLSDYLGLVALVGLFLSALGSIYLFQSFLVRRQKEIAILISLGLRHSIALQVYLLQILLLALLATLFTFALSASALPVLKSFIQQLTPFDLQVGVGVRSFLVALFLATLGSLLVCLPILSRILQLSVSSLFQEDTQVDVKTQARNWLWILPAIAGFIMLSIWQANSYKVGFMFVGALFASAMILGIFAFVILYACQKICNFPTWYWKQAFLSLSRRRAATLSCFLALGLGSLLMNLLPQLKVSLQYEMASPTSSLPSLFLFDIQDDQIQGVRKFLGDKQIQLQSESPLIRARILKVNDADFEKASEGSQFKTREEETEARFRNRGFNLSYREGLSESESLVAGRAFSGQYNSESGELPEISVEEKFADRLGFKIGDRLLFDVQGVPIEGKIVNLRKVKWTSFQPNFFVIFQPGVFDEAPKIWLASIPAMPLADKARLETELVKNFSNVSVLDVDRTVTRVLDMLAQMSWSLELMSALALFAGFVVLYSIASHQASTRRWDINMMKILGASFGDLQKFVLVEFAFLGFIGALLGVILSFGVSFVMSRYIFDGAWSFQIFWPLFTLGLVTTLSFAVAWWVTRGVLKEKSSELLNSQRR